MASSIAIGNRTIRQGGRPYIIAEIGQAHHGAIEEARSLCEAAARAGADAVKWQHHHADSEGISRRDYWAAMEFSTAQWLDLRALGQNLGVDFIVSPFSLKSVEIIGEGVGVDAWKIPSAPYWYERLHACAETGQPLIISTGMSAQAEIDLMAALVHPIAFMQCTSRYPTPLSEVGLSLIGSLHSRYRVPVGLSDHTGSIWPSVAAMALGAPLIEVHVGWSREQSHPDAKASLTFQELAQVVAARDAIELMRNPVDKDAMAAALEETRRRYGHTTRA